MNVLKLNYTLIANLVLFIGVNSVVRSEEPDSNYNVVIILADDLGYADLGCYGGEGITPNIDELAQSGIRFTDFYATPVCSASRAALLSGCYPQRVGIEGVINLNSKVGINPHEKLLPEILRDQGYKTALFGKWHLGDRKAFYPNQHGFDKFYGTLTSNDMGVDMSPDARRYGRLGLSLFEDQDTVTSEPKQWELIKSYTERSLDFIAKNKDNPFFLFLSYNAPHTPLFVRNEFGGSSKLDLYHDVVAEIDWSVGEVIAALEKNSLREKTLVVFLSDNGPWLIFGNHGGSATPLRGGKKQTLEGGVRVPCIVSLPNVVTQGAVFSELAAIMDLYPTIASLTGAKMTGEIIDGKDMAGVFKGLDSNSPRGTYYYYYKDGLQAVRMGQYKLQLSYLDREAPDSTRVGYDGFRGKVHPVDVPLALFDLKADPSESINVISKYPTVVAELMAIVETARAELGDSYVGRVGTERRKAGLAPAK